MASVPNSRRIPSNLVSPRFTPALVFFGALALCPLITSPNELAGQTVPAQSQASKTTPAPKHHSPKKQTKAQKVAEEAAAQQAALEQAKPSDPPPPDWPVNDKALAAKVGWNGRDLSISATNASLAQILHDISTATGVKVEGLGSDQRVFGSYGPALARDVIAQLLEGSGYNVMIIGDKGEGTPRELVLTTKAKTSSASQPANGQQGQSSDDEVVEEPEQQPEPQPEPPHQRPPGGPPQPGQGPRTPQQMMQELQQRQQQQIANPQAPPQ